MNCAVVAVGGRNGGDERNNAPFINEDGDHVYYDRRLIEMKEFRKRHPEVKDRRTFRRLFSRRLKDKP